MSLRSDIAASAHALPGFILIGLGWASISAQMPALKAQVGLTDMGLGLLMLVGAAGAMMSMFLAPLVERWIGRYAMAAPLLLMAFGFVGCGLATGPFVFGLGMLLAGIGSGVGDVIANAETSVQESATGRSLMNLCHGVFSITYMFAAMAVGQARAMDWAPIQIFLCLLVAVVVCLPWTILPHRDAISQPETDGPAVKTSGIVWLGGLVVLAAFLGEAASEGWSALHVERTLGGSPKEGAYGPALLAAGMAIGRIGGHLFAAHLPALRVMIVATALAGVGLGLVAAVDGIGLAYCGFFLGGLGVSVVGPLALGLVGQSVPAHLRLHAISRAAAMGYAAFFIGPVVMGLLSQSFGLRAAFAALSGIMAVAAFILLPIWAARLAR